MSSGSSAAPRIHVSGLTMAYGSFVIQHDLDFSVERGEVFVIMGGSGSGKSTLLNHMVGLKIPARGDVIYDGESFSRDIRDPGAPAPALRGVVPERRTLELDDAGGERRPAAADVHAPAGASGPRDRVAQARAGGPGRLRRVLSVRGQRWDAQTRRCRARDGARPRYPVLRRALGRARSDQLAPARRSHP